MDKFNRNVLERLNKLSFRLQLDRGNFAANIADWLGFQFPQTGMKPKISKVQVNRDNLQPITSKKPRSFFRVLNQMNRYIPNPAKLFSIPTSARKSEKLGLGRGARQSVPPNKSKHQIRRGGKTF